MKTVIISDLHLKFSETSEDIERRERVVSFLESLKNNTERIIFNGDIFDLWFAWDSVIIRGYYKFYRVLSELNDLGCKLILTKGNHDFWFNDFLEKEIGFQIVSRFEFESGNKKILVLHGDQFTSNDLRYLIFRKIIRNPILKKIFYLIHPEFGLNIGKLLSRSSRDRKKNSEIEKTKEKGLIDYAQIMLKEYDCIVMGHTHNPIQIDFENGIYINSGDWISHNSYVEFNDDLIELKSYE